MEEGIVRAGKAERALCDLQGGWQAGPRAMIMMHLGLWRLVWLIGVLEWGEAVGGGRPVLMNDRG